MRSEIAPPDPTKLAFLTCRQSMGKSSRSKRQSSTSRACFVHGSRMLANEITSREALPFLPEHANFNVGQKDGKSISSAGPTVRMATRGNLLVLMRSYRH